MWGKKILQVVGLGKKITFSHWFVSQPWSNNCEVIWDHWEIINVMILTGCPDLVRTPRGGGCPFWAIILRKIVCIQYAFVLKCPKITLHDKCIYFAEFMHLSIFIWLFTRRDRGQIWPVQYIKSFTHPASNDFWVVPNSCKNCQWFGTFIFKVDSLHVTAPSVWMRHICGTKLS